MTGRRFEVIDLIKGPVPKADVFLVRDCLVHLSNRHIEMALKNILLSGSDWLLTTTFIETGTNEDIATGQWRAVNLTMPPFNLPALQKLLPEGKAEVRGQYADKTLGLWKISELKEIAETDR